MPEKTSDFQPAVRLVLLIICCVFIGEFLVMILIALIPSLSVPVRALVDATFLIILLAPVLYFGLFRLLIQIIEQRRHAEEELKNHRDHLEELVNERTKEIAALLESSRAVLKHRDFEISARLILEKSKETIGAQVGYVALLNKAGTESEIWYPDSGGVSCTVDPSLPMPIGGFQKEAFDKGEAVYENHFNDIQWQQFMLRGHALCQSVMFIPLIIDEKPIGL